jgi:hypothetical protein
MAAYQIAGDVVELVDTLVLEASAVRRVGSSPTVPTSFSEGKAPLSTHAIDSCDLPILHK